MLYTGYDLPIEYTTHVLYTGCDLPIAMNISPTHMPVLADDSVKTRLCSSANALAS